jgi:DNA-binding NarL/FixJ family response regulator
VIAGSASCGHHGSHAPTPIRVLIVEDHELVRTALAELLDGQDDLIVVGVCGDGSEVVEAAARLRPDVVVMDVRMPRMDGLTATRELLGCQPEARVVILTSKADAEPAAAAAGARGFVSKDADPMELLQCVRSVVAA